MLLSIIVSLESDNTSEHALINDIVTRDDFSSGNIELIFVGPHSVNVINNTPSTQHINTAPSHSGYSEYLKIGAEYATGDILLFLSCGSILPKHFLKEIVTAIDKGYNAGVFSSDSGKQNIFSRILKNSLNWGHMVKPLSFREQGLFIRKELFIYVSGNNMMPESDETGLIKRLKISGEKIFFSKLKIR